MILLLKKSNSLHKQKMPGSHEDVQTAAMPPCLSRRNLLAVKPDEVSLPGSGCVDGCVSGKAGNLGQSQNTARSGRYLETDDYGQERTVTDARTSVSALAELRRNKNTPHPAAVPPYEVPLTGSGCVKNCVLGQTGKFAQSQNTPLFFESERGFGGKRKPSFLVKRKFSLSPNAISPFSGTGADKKGLMLLHQPGK